MKPKIIVLHTSGINRDHEAAWACDLAGGQPEIVHLNQLCGDGATHRLADYQMLVIAGGFSYGDALGAGKRFAIDLQYRLSDALREFNAVGKPILGICNGFQALLKAKLLTPDTVATLTHNERAHFECRWVTLQPNPNSPCIFTRQLTEPIYCPVAHGEGRVVVRDNLPEPQIALRYEGSAYPSNPNGSHDDVAGITNESGTILGLMPHPEDHIVAWQHPRWTRGERGFSGLPLFAAGVEYVKQS